MGDSKKSYPALAVIVELILDDCTSADIVRMLAGGWCAASGFSAFATRA
jgi:hypothetical protein